MGTVFFLIGIAIIALPCGGIFVYHRRWQAAHPEEDEESAEAANQWLRGE